MGDLISSVNLGDPKIVECQVLFRKYSGCHVDDLKYPERLPLPQGWRVANIVPSFSSECLSGPLPKGIIFYLQLQ